MNDVKKKIFEKLLSSDGQNYILNLEEMEIAESYFNFFDEFNFSFYKTHEIKIRNFDFMLTEDERLAEWSNHFFEVGEFHTSIFETFEKGLVVKRVIPKFLLNMEDFKKITNETQKDKWDNPLNLNRVGTHDPYDEPNAIWFPKKSGYDFGTNFSKIKNRDLGNLNISKEILSRISGEYS